MRKIIDCFLYNGEDEILDLRIQELDSIIDEFWIIEGEYTFTGIPKELKFKKQALSRKWPLSKIKYYPYSPQSPLSDDPWANELAQRNHIGSLIDECNSDDLILFSDVDEIPKPEAVLTARIDVWSQCFGFEMSTHYFKLNFTLIEPPRFAKQVWSIAFVADVLRIHTAQQLRMGIRDRSIQARILDNGGWHFSYLMNEDQIHDKIKSFSHQEFNYPEFLEKISVQRILESKEDLFSRDEHAWDFCSIAELPQSVKDNPRKYRKHLYENAFRWPIPRIFGLRG